MLLNRKEVDVNATDQHGSTPLLLASESGHAGTASVLSKQGGANVNIVNNHGITSLHAAMAREHSDIATFLVEHGGPLSPDVINMRHKHEYWTPLLRAMEKGLVKLTSLLVQTGKADVTIPVIAASNFINSTHAG
jgi:ankyrin repeat domain-containing protein 50